MNKVIVIGRITKDIELRSTDTGKNIANFNIAVNEGTGDKQRTDFIEIIAWENNAIFISKYFNKGKKILIDGSLRTSSYEKDGIKRTKTYVLAQHIEFVDSKKEETNINKEEFESSFETEDIVLNDDELPF